MAASGRHIALGSRGAGDGNRHRMSSAAWSADWKFDAGRRNTSRLDVLAKASEVCSTAKQCISRLQTMCAIRKLDERKDLQRVLAA